MIGWTWEKDEKAGNIKSGMKWDKVGCTGRLAWSAWRGKQAQRARTADANAAVANIVLFRVSVDEKLLALVMPRR